MGSYFDLKLGNYFGLKLGNYFEFDCLVSDFENYFEFDLQNYF